MAVGHYQFEAIHPFEDGNGRTGRVINILYLFTRELVDVIFEQPYCRISNLVNKGVAKRQAASKYLKDMVALGVLVEQPAGKEKLFIHPKLMKLLSYDSNQFVPYFGVETE